jgi:CxxC motif-containing protein (DUF1111 family)
MYKMTRRQIVSSLSVAPFLVSTVLADAPAYKVKYSGGSLPNVKSGQELALALNSSDVSLSEKHQSPVVIPVKAITEISYGQEVHRRIGTAVGLAVISLGIGALTAFSKSKKHYIGLTWADGDKKGGLVIQADKDEYRGLIAALEGITGKKAVDTDLAKKS